MDFITLIRSTLWYTTFFKDQNDKTSCALWYLNQYHQVFSILAISLPTIAKADGQVPTASKSAKITALKFSNKSPSKLCN